MSSAFSIRTWPGVVLGLLALVAVELPATVTRVGVYMATDPSAVWRARGISLLRTFGSENALLRMCYVRAGNATDMVKASLVSLHRSPLYRRCARRLYYQVTGRAFNSAPAPVDFHRPRGALRCGRLRYRPGQRNRGRPRGGPLARELMTRRFRGDADAALGYLEWTMVFKNSSPQAQEVRAQIALPPGAVVSRVTLWIDGEEREGGIRRSPAGEGVSGRGQQEPRSGAGDERGRRSHLHAALRFRIQVR